MEAAYSSKKFQQFDVGAQRKTISNMNVFTRNKKCLHKQLEEELYIGMLVYNGTMISRTNNIIKVQLQWLGVEAPNLN